MEADNFHVMDNSARANGIHLLIETMMYLRPLSRRIFELMQWFPKLPTGTILFFDKKSSLLRYGQDIRKVLLV
jgi:hypothetical protein